LLGVYIAANGMTHRVASILVFGQRFQVSLYDGRLVVNRHQAALHPFTPIQRQWHVRWPGSAAGPYDKRTDRGRVPGAASPLCQVPVAPSQAALFGRRRCLTANELRLRRGRSCSSSSTSRAPALVRGAPQGAAWAQPCSDRSKARFDKRSTPLNTIKTPQSAGYEPTACLPWPDRQCCVPRTWECC
jgi:hypothetical protein